MMILKMFITLFIYKSLKTIINISLKNKKLIAELESTHKKLITELEFKINSLESTPIIFGYSPHDFSNNLVYTPQTQLLDLTTINDKMVWCGNYFDFNKLTSVKTIILYTYQFKYRALQEHIMCTNILEPQLISTYNTNLSITTLYNYPYQIININNLFNHYTIYLPSVTEIFISYSSSLELQEEKLGSLLNLQEVTFNNFIVKLSCFEFIKKNNKLKVIHFVNYTCINQLDEIKRYYDSNHIIAYFN